VAFYDRLFLFLEIVCFIAEEFHIFRPFRVSHGENPSSAALI
jgi:hypothetical protein